MKQYTWFILGLLFLLSGQSRSMQWHRTIPLDRITQSHIEKLEEKIQILNIKIIEDIQELAILNNQPTLSDEEQMSKQELLMSIARKNTKKEELHHIHQELNKQYRSHNISLTLE